MWVDEAIWGHRFHNEQTPWIVMLEFLAVFMDRDRGRDGGNAPGEEGANRPAAGALQEEFPPGEHEWFIYGIPKRPALRTLVFKNPHLGQIETHTDSDSARWDEWFQRMGGGTDHAHLRDRFLSYRDFARVVEFFRNTSVEPHRRRRWSSRFLFPYGPDCVYADLKERRGALESSDRLFFARGGELLYLMLGRSGRRAELAGLVRDRLLNPDNTWNRLARTLVPRGPDPEVVTLDVGYLPHAKLPDYDLLADDWARLLGLALPGASVLDPLVRLTGLHMVLYHLRRSHEEIGSKSGPTIVLEIAAPRKTVLFGLSRDSHGENAKLARRAVEAYLDAFRRGPEWDESASAEAAWKTLTDCHLRWKPGKREHAGSPKALFDTFKEAALERNERHVASAVPVWSRSIGLSSARKGVGTWYHPDDAFLKALVLATVDGRKDYRAFLGNLHDRYGLVVGVPEAEKAFGRLPVDEKALSENASRLEHRLRALGLLRRLSDDCAYVVNPFGHRP